MEQARKSDLVDVTVQIKHRTDRAILVNDGGEENKWLPLAQIEVAQNIDGATYTVTMPEWLAIEQGLV